MNQIYVISDTHGKQACIDYIRRIRHPSDICIHCGDSLLSHHALEDFIVVQGNNDFYGEFDEYRILTFDHHRLYICHGHRELFFEPMIQKAKRLQCDIVISGHTHRPLQHEQQGILFLNPGSMWHNRDGSLPSYMILDQDDPTKVTLKRFNE